LAESRLLGDTEGPAVERKASGTYLLLPASVDQEIARDFILFGRPDVTVIVVDATRLEWPSPSLPPALNSIDTIAE
jgi:hypothetical protein